MSKKRKIFLLYFLSLNFSFLISFAQTNLVPNPSFEDTVNCPVGQGELYKAVGWSSYKDSPDYMNACSLPGGFSVPSNWGGYQQAASGKAYAAIASYASKIYGSNYREYAGQALSTPLTLGTKYFVSFKVSLGISPSAGGNCASNKIGAKFSKTIFNVFNPMPVNNAAKVYSNSIITDTLNWTRIFGSFVSDSVYKYISIGNFFDDNNTDTLIMDFSSICNYAYYFLDDVCVSTDSLFALNYQYVGISENEILNSFRIYPNPVQKSININNQSESKFGIEIFNVLGKLLYAYEDIKEKNFQIDLSAVDQGLLFIKIHSEKFTHNYKLIKQ